MSCLLTNFQLNRIKVSTEDDPRLVDNVDSLNEFSCCSVCIRSFFLIFFFVIFVTRVNTSGNKESCDGIRTIQSFLRDMIVYIIRMRFSYIYAWKITKKGQKKSWSKIVLKKKCFWLRKRNFFFFFFKTLKKENEKMQPKKNFFKTLKKKMKEIKDKKKKISVQHQNFFYFFW